MMMKLLLISYSWSGKRKISCCTLEWKEKEFLLAFPRTGNPKNEKEKGFVRLKKTTYKKNTLKLSTLGFAVGALVGKEEDHDSRTLVSRGSSIIIILSITPVIMDDSGYISRHELHGNVESLFVDVNIARYEEAMQLGRKLGTKRQTIRRLAITLNDSNIQKHHEYMIWLFAGGLTRNLSLQEISFIGINFGMNTAFFATSLRVFLLRNNNMRKITFDLCLFRNISQFSSMRHCILASESIKCICFKDIDFDRVRGNKCVVMAYLSQAFGERAVYFKDCHLRSRHLRELIRGISDVNHPVVLAIEGNRSSLNNHLCSLLHRELTNHTVAETMPDPKANVMAASNPAISALSLKGSLLGDVGVYSLLTGNEPYALALVRLNLSDCHISDPGCAVIASTLKHARAPHLKKLILSNNRINDEGATMIARALRFNSKLRTLSLSHSSGRITDQTWLEFERVLFNNSSISAIKRSNHFLTNLALSSEHGMNVSTAIQKRLENLLLLNEVSKKSVDMVVAEKLLEFVHSSLLEHGVIELAKRLFPSLNTRLNWNQISFLLIYWTSNVYRRTYDVDSWANDNLSNSEYRVNHIGSARELTILYVVIASRINILVNTHAPPYLRSHKKRFDYVPHCVEFHRSLRTR